MTVVCRRKGDGLHTHAHGFSHGSVVGPLQGQPALWEAEQGARQNLWGLDAEAEGVQGRLGGVRDGPALHSSL